MPLEPLAFQPMDPVNALLGWVASSLGDVLLVGATRALFGPPAERALRGAFSRAIDTATDQLTAGQTDLSRELRAALCRSRKALARPGQFPDLPQLVDAWVNAVDADPAGPGRLGALGVDRVRLAETLCAEITREVIADGLNNGPLQPLATHANFQRAFGLSQEVLARLGSIEAMQEEIRRAQEQQPERETRLGAADGARTLIDSRAATFTGRQYILDQLDAIIGNRAFPSGYVLITGEPGIGKTALVSHLIKERNYPYHLNDRRQGVTSTREFLSSVCPQLAARCGITISSVPSSLTLSMLLRKAAEGAGPGHPVVIVVDALDESEPSVGANRLLLPQVLPQYVYFLITSRPQADYELSVDHLKIVSIEDDDPLNFSDIRSYIQRELNGPFGGDFAQRIDAWGVSEKAFTDTLVGKSQGNFMYIVHMLSSVRLNRLTEAAMDDIRHLPTGLRGYYLDHWQVMQERWPPALWKKHEAAVRCLAVMKRPVSPAMLVDMAEEENLPGVDEDLARAIFTEWREFLNSKHDKHHDEERYYVYHDTFREFLESKETLKPLERRLQRNQIRLLRQIIEEDD